MSVICVRAFALTTRSTVRSLFTFARPCSVRLYSSFVPTTRISPLVRISRSLCSKHPTMPPIDNSRLEQLIASKSVVIFSKTTCPYCTKVKQLFNSLNVSFHAVELNNAEDGAQLADLLKAKVGRTSVPQVFVQGTHVGGCDDTLAANESGKLAELLKDCESYDYDLVVIGGGSGGLAASKEAAKLGKRVALLDFVQPTPQGTTWGLGGTCVNVGCIPKKLMHQAALIGSTIRHSSKFGWETKDGAPVEDVVAHNWETMVDSVQANIKSSNFKYRVAVRNEKVQYLNSYGTFVDDHKMRLVDKKGVEKFITSEHFLVATGERPKYPDDCEGAYEYGITSDDLFSLPYNPGKTIVVGASYVALECAGFLRGFNLDVTVVVRSILLRGFDQEIAEMIGEHMTEEGVQFIRPAVPFKVEQLEPRTESGPGLLRVHIRLASGECVTQECNTLLFAIGRKPCTDNIGLDVVGVQVEKNGKLPVVQEQTNVPHIYAVGDILSGKPELTPVAIEAGLLLVRRLYASGSQQCDYENVPTTVFTPLEYGACGLSEEAAIQKYGEENVEVYIQYLTPFEWTIAHHLDNKCYAKLITVINDNERIVGFHYLGPNAGEIAQLAAIMLKKKTVKAELDSIIGIHPTCAEVFTNMRVTKRSGESAIPQGCCG